MYRSDHVQTNKGALVNGRLSIQEKEDLIQIAERVISITPEQQSTWVLAAKWDDKWKGYKPFLTSFSHFDNDPGAILLRAHFKPFVRELEQTGIKSKATHPDDLSEFFRSKPKTANSNKNGPVYLRTTRTPINWKKEKPFVWPTDLDQVPGWSNEKENKLNAELRAQGLYKPESEPLWPQMSDFRQGYKREVSSQTQKIIDRTIPEIRLRYPDNKTDETLQRIFDFKSVFDSLSGRSIINQFMANPPQDLKQSILQELVESNALEAMPFKTKSTAFMLSKGFRNPETATQVFLNECLGFKKLPNSKHDKYQNIFAVDDFYIHQSVLESLLQKIISASNIWGRFYQVMDGLTDKQKQVIEMLYLGRTPKTYLEASDVLGISIDSVRDREVGAIQKFRKAFPEFKDFHPYKDWSKNQKRLYSFDGMVYIPTRDFVHPLYRIKQVGNLELYEWIGGEKSDSLEDK